jgi:hypothetical protein
MENTHATSTNQGILEAKNTTLESASGQKSGESSASFETRLGAFNYQRESDAQKKGG